MNTESGRVLFPENIELVDTTKVGISVKQRDQLQRKSLAMRDVVDPCGLGLTKDALAKYDKNLISEKDMYVIAELAEEVVTNEKALESLENFVEFFHEIMQLLSLSLDHRTLIGVFISTATHFILLAKLYLEGIKSPSIVERSGIWLVYLRPARVFVDILKNWIIFTLKI